MADRLLTFTVYVTAFLVCAVLGWILYDIFSNGFSHFLSWDFISTEPENSGRAGGIGPIIISTLAILFVALVTAVPLGLCVAIWLSEFSRKDSRFGLNIRLSLDVLAGIPSIVYGLFGNAFFCIILGMGFSILAGGLTLACMILPVFIRICEMGLSTVNKQWRQAATGLGMRKFTTLIYILLPATAPAIIAGLTLSIGRATAETAVLLFTSGYVDRMPESLLDSGRALAVHIYDLAMNVTGGDHAAYASAVVLILIIILLNIATQKLIANWLGYKELYL